jgi:DNA-binding transcriptional ArsR family regulator
MRITDPRAIRALAHPLRLDLIEALATLGPSTAARCGRHLGVSQASCSFHLRQLAKYGFVEEAPPGPDRRERTWRLTDVEQAWESGPMTDQLDRVFVQREADRMIAWTGRRDGEPAEWRDAAFVGGATLPVTAEELLQLRRDLRAVLEPYVTRLTDPAARPDGARFVRLVLAGTPGPGDARPAAEDAGPAAEDAGSAAEDAPPAVADVGSAVADVGSAVEDAPPAAAEDAPPAAAEDAPPAAAEDAPPAAAEDAPPAAAEDAPPAAAEDAPPAAAEDARPAVEDAGPAAPGGGAADTAETGPRDA